MLFSADFRQMLIDRHAEDYKKIIVEFLHREDQQLFHDELPD